MNQGRGHQIAFLACKLELLKQRPSCFLLSWNLFCLSNLVRSCQARGNRRGPECCLPLSCSRTPFYVLSKKRNRQSEPSAWLHIDWDCTKQVQQCQNQHQNTSLTRSFCLESMLVSKKPQLWVFCGVSQSIFLCCGQRLKFFQFGKCSSNEFQGLGWLCTKVVWTRTNQELWGRIEVPLKLKRCLTVVLKQFDPLSLYVWTTLIDSPT